MVEEVENNRCVVVSNTLLTSQEQADPFLPFSELKQEEFK